jgi:hypothetical protein
LIRSQFPEFSMFILRMEDDRIQKSNAWKVPSGHDGYLVDSIRWHLFLMLIVAHWNPMERQVWSRVFWFECRIHTRYCKALFCGEVSIPSKAGSSVREIPRQDRLTWEANFITWSTRCVIFCFSGEMQNPDPLLPALIHFWPMRIGHTGWSRGPQYKICSK